MSGPLFALPNGTANSPEVRVAQLLRDRDSLEAQLAGALAALAQRTRERDALRVACFAALRVCQEAPSEQLERFAVADQIRAALRAEVSQ